MQALRQKDNTLSATSPQKDVYQTGKLRRSTLVSLRWLAIGGQLLSIGLVWLVFRFDFPIAASLMVVCLSILMNVAIITSAPLDRRIGCVEVGFQLGFDVLQLSALLFLTGGIINPFVILLLAPVVVAAKTLNKGVFSAMVVWVTVLSVGLLLWHFPLPWFTGQTLELPRMYQYGIWVSVIVGMLFTSTYTWRASAQTRRMTQAFAASEAILFQEKKLSALGGLAAAAAHELGTPLATIQITAKEMALAAKEGSELSEDANLLVSQAQRCKAILQNLAHHGDKGDEVHDRLDLQALLGEITKPFRGSDVDITTSLIAPHEGADMPVFERRAEFVYGLTNIVENAVDFASKSVWVSAAWDEDAIFITVLDDGPGFDPSIASKIGEPYVSFRQGDTHKSGGLGLGVFIAKTLIERIGGHMSLSNRMGTPGAQVKLCWPYTKA